MPKRVQSPSSINTYKQCPRRYFYQYIIKYPTKENIHTVRGNIVHEALEKFFSVDINTINEGSFKKDISFYMKNLFDACWAGASTRLHRLGIDDERISFYYNESTQMLANWLNHLFDDLEKEMKGSGSGMHEAFRRLKPIELEKEFRDSELMVRGFIDAIHKDGDDIILFDYKTSKSSELKDEYMLQLGIYAMLYERQHGKYPSKVGLWFLKDRPVTIKVTPKLIKDALFEVEQIHLATESVKIGDYPKKESGLCKWSTGQCDFFDICMRER
ncbi:PD-(D/E)XK nuclease family protein [Candidatus Woesearchaeota archaeon]|nr:PD-(D/E)XK nuclease family protein [Candidatus Woesearchaeota archaeon]